MPGDGQGMPLEVPLLSSDLKRGGYATHMLGKWHLGFRTVENLPASRGFDTYFGLLGGGADHYTKTEEACGGDGETCRCKNLSSTKLPFRVDFWDGLAPAHALWDNTTYDAFQYTSRAVELVEQHDLTRPFFLYWAPHKVHSPLQCPEEFTKQYPLDPGGVCQSTPETCGRRGYGPSCGCAHMCYCNRRIIRGMVSVVDAMLYNLTAALKTKGMWETTVLIFLGDNGAPNQNAGSNSVFKGEKFGHYEGGHRVPTFIGGPLVSRSPLSGLWHNSTTHLVDLHASILDMAGVVAADPHKSNGSWVPPVDGVSLLPILNGTMAPGTDTRPELWIADDVLRVGSWKLITGGGAASTQNMLGIGGRPVRTPYDPNDLNTTCGYSHCRGNETGVDAELCIGCRCRSYNMSDPTCHACLYNVDADPGEQTNHAAAQLAMVASMHAKLFQYRKMNPAKPAQPPGDAYGACEAMVKQYGGFYGPWAAPSPAPVNPCSTGTAGGYVCHAASCATENGQGCVGLLPDPTFNNCPHNGDYACATAVAAELCAAKRGCVGYALSERMWGTVKLYNKQATVQAHADWTVWMK